MIAVNNRISSKIMLREWLREELSYYRVNSVLGYIKMAFELGESAILAKYQLILRKCEFCFNTNHKLGYMFYRIRLCKIQNKYSIHIPINCAGRGLMLKHVGPVLWNDKVSVGEHCTIHINTSLVAGKIGGCPTLGNNVYMGVGSIVLGNVYIADNVVIGANAVVCKDINESNISIAGVPAHKLHGKVGMK